MADHLRSLLGAGAQALGVDLDATKTDRLLCYQQLLARWNKAFNLTAVRGDEAMIVRHLLDSLAIAPHLHGAQFADVGTGPGLPGIPLAILYPERHFSLLDSNGKKTRFLFQVKSQLGLSNIDIIEGRVEQWQPEESFDGVITRAFAELALTCSLSEHLLTRGGRLYAMKSQSIARELETLPESFALVDNIPLTVPGLEESRWLTVLAHQVKQEQS